MSVQTYDFNTTVTNCTHPTEEQFWIEPSKSSQATRYGGAWGGEGGIVSTHSRLRQ
jgi:hypothetical protein